MNWESVVACRKSSSVASRRENKEALFMVCLDANHLPHKFWGSRAVPTSDRAVLPHKQHSQNTLQEGWRRSPSELSMLKKGSDVMLGNFLLGTVVQYCRSMKLRNLLPGLRDCMSMNWKLISSKTTKSLRKATE